MSEGKRPERPELQPVKLPEHINWRVLGFHDDQGREWVLNHGPRALPVEDKIRIINEIILPLRTYQQIGMLEGRRWIEVLFPEFAEIRDREMDAYLEKLAGDEGISESNKEEE